VNTSAPSTDSPAPAATTTPAAPSSAPAGTSPAPAKGAKSAAATSDAAGKSPAPRGKAQDRIELDATQITGNRELPKVLYIVPWKNSDLGDLVGKPANSLLDEVLQPVDRDVFRRENRYYDALAPGADKDGAKPAAAP
jgi:hypothetical protein